MNTVLSKVCQAYLAIENKKVKGQSKYFQLYEAIKGCIQRVDLPPQAQLTPSRQLGKALGLSRSTVIKSYELLNLEGYISAKQGAGYTIKALDSSLQDEQAAVDPHIEYPELSVVARAFMQNVGKLNTTDDKSVGFRPGLPPLDIFPVNQWKNLSNTYWRYIKSSALSYSPSSGNEQLKRSLAAYLNLSRGVKCEPSQIIIVSGSLQSLYLLGSVLINPGDTVLTENPTFPNVKSIFSSLRANMLGVPVDEEGIQLQEMDSARHRKAKLIHLTPSNHYPKGVQMSMQRRKEILEYAHKNQAFIIENDYEHEVNNFSREQSLPSLFNLDQQSRTIFLGTFNRLLHPSIRVGYMVLPPYLIQAVEALLKHSHRFVAPSIQVVLHQFIEKKYIYGHIKNVVKTADARKKTFIEAYQELLGHRYPIQAPGIRSLHLLAHLPKGEKDQPICKDLVRNNILVHAYSKCFVGEPTDQGFIFGYSSVRGVSARRKLQRLAKQLT